MKRKTPFFKLIQLIFVLSGLTTTQLSAQSEQVIVLQYHHVDDSTPASTSISPTNFTAHLDYLESNNFTFLRLEEAIKALKEGRELPQNSVAITFDDAYQSVYSDAFPVLSAREIPFTIFINDSLISNNSSLYLSWSQLNEMGLHGATLANHTSSHNYLLEQLEHESEEEWLDRIRDEITGSEEAIQRQTGQSHKLLAYPYGEYNPQIQSLIVELGYSAFGQQSGPISSGSDFTALPRFPLSGPYAGMSSFPLKMNSLAFSVKTTSPQSPVVSDGSPLASLEFDSFGFEPATLNCFHNNELMTITFEGNIAHLSTSQNSTSRRFRYNCTARSVTGNYFWYSIPWVNPEITE